jgi:hypothetical protein
VLVAAAPEGSQALDELGRTVDAGTGRFEQTHARVAQNKESLYMRLYARCPSTRMSR